MAKLKRITKETCVEYKDLSESNKQAVKEFVYSADALSRLEKAYSTMVIEESGHKENFSLLKCKEGAHRSAIVLLKEAFAVCLDPEYQIRDKTDFGTIVSTVATNNLLELLDLTHEGVVGRVYTNTTEVVGSPHMGMADLLLAILADDLKQEGLDMGTGQSAVADMFRRR